MLSGFSSRPIDQVMSIVIDRCRYREEGKRMVDLHSQVQHATTTISRWTYSKVIGLKKIIDRK